jgi:hypothetical protein
VGWILLVVVASFSAVAIGVILLDGPERPEVVGDVVIVHNRRCAMNGAPIPPEALGRWTSRVLYDGPVDAYRGKTLVFNQCCPDCVDSFPALWAQDRDRIMREMGLDDSAP